MDDFKRLQELLQVEKEEDRSTFEQLRKSLPVAERRAGGMTWYPVAIRDTEIGRGDYLSVEIERTTHQDVIHQLRFGMTAALFSQHDADSDRIEGTIASISGNRLKLSLRTDELPEWTRNGKLGIDAVFDENSYREMENALKLAPLLAEKKEEGSLARILIGKQAPQFETVPAPPALPGLNAIQQLAVARIIAARELAIVHGPPGTGKTTTLVRAIAEMAKRDEGRLLVTAPSNAAVDLLSEKLSAAGLNVVRIGNPARVSESQVLLTLDSKITAHGSSKEIKRLKKRAAEFRELARKYKRSFGREEREQRNALFAEARSIGKQVERMEQYITDDILSKAQVITSTLVGANHYSIRHLRYHTAVIDEAGQALEPACWIPVLKARKLVMAGDHCQLPPTVKSAVAARDGLGVTLMEKCVALHPAAVVLLEVQYRMHETIMGFPSAVFYGNRLQADAAVARHLLAPGDRPLLFLDTAGCGFEEKWEGTNLSNAEEADFLLRHLVLLVQSLSDGYAEDAFPRIAVISPYKQQVELLKEKVGAAKDLEVARGSIAVNTIDSFQGQERDIVYISMTRSNAEGVIGFLSDVRRMNVAMTRARKKLVIVGDSATLSQLPFYASLVAYAQEHDAYQSAWELMEW